MSIIARNGQVVRIVALQPEGRGMEFSHCRSTILIDSLVLAATPLGKKTNIGISPVKEINNMG